MQKGIDQLTAALQREYPGITIEQHRVAHPDEDDDGLWYINHPRAIAEVQVESSTGDAPFLIESDLAPPTVARTVTEAVRTCVDRLGLSIQRNASH